ncbi:hypothetical protein PanWU01x14_335900, partial [Parasponia andersonii]
EKGNGDATLTLSNEHRFCSSPSKATICLKNEIAATFHECSLAGRSYFHFLILGIVRIL